MIFLSMLIGSRALITRNILVFSNKSDFTIVGESRLFIAWVAVRNIMTAAVFNFFSCGPYTRWNVLSVSISPEIIDSVAALFTTSVCLALSCAQSRPYRIANTWITLTYRFERVTLHPDTALSQRYPVAYVSAITVAVRHFIVPTSLPSPYRSVSSSR